jgi:hypothetical protein
VQKEQNLRRKGNWHTQHVVRKHREVIKQQLIAVEQEFKERK